ncbi:hypothetical protein GCM10023069_67170 [Shinella granuli]
MARRIVTDDEDGKAGLHAGILLQGGSGGLHGVNHGSGNLLPIDNGGHISLPE